MTKAQRKNRILRTYFWWVHELSKAVTPRRSGERPWRTLMRHTSEGWEILVRAAGTTRSLAVLDARATPDAVAEIRRTILQQASQNSRQVVLRLSASDVVQRTIQIPGAASDLLDSIVENKVETIVPWPQERTNYGYRVLTQNPASADQLDTMIIATTTNVVDAALATARGIGLSPCAVDFAPDAAAIPIELMSLEADPITKTAARINKAFAVVLVASLATSAFGFFQVWDLDARYSELQSRIAAVMTRVEGVKRLNEENAKLREQRERLAKRKIDDPAVMVLIEALSRALPDSAYLDQFEIHDGEARIDGKSADPTGLISALESTPEFEDVRFAAPTTREEGQTLGTFSIVARVQNEMRAKGTQ